MSTTNRYTRGVRDRAVKTVLDHEEEYDSQWPAIKSLWEKIGCAAETPGESTGLRSHGGPLRKPPKRRAWRNRNILSIREPGRREWHKSSGYNGRAMVENAVFRYKTIMGRGTRSRTLGSQREEVRLMTPG